MTSIKLAEPNQQNQIDFVQIFSYFVPGLEKIGFFKFNSDFFNLN